jgi:dTDP-4-dehydrorhamnose 3,5-epimerase
VQARPLSIDGAWCFTPVQHGDDRGVFLESFTDTSFRAAIGHRLDLRQMNVSVSRAGTIRGVHFADVPPGQAKYVQCFSGRILDIVVDIRVGSPTFGAYDAIEIDATDRCGIYVSEGLGHAFCALTDDATVGYLCSTPYTPSREHGVTPMDSALALPWPDLPLLLSTKDIEAPTLDEARTAGLLPTYEECQAFVAAQRDLS